MVDHCKESADQRSARIEARLAEAERERDALRAVAQQFLADYHSADGMASYKQYAHEFRTALTACSASVAPCTWEPSDMWPIMRYQCGPTNSSGTAAGADYKFCPFCGGEITTATVTPDSAPAVTNADELRLNWLEEHDGRFHNIDRISAIVGKGFNGMPSVRDAIDIGMAADSAPAVVTHDITNETHYIVDSAVSAPVCVACEGNPIHPNNPCAVCGAAVAAGV